MLSLTFESITKIITEDKSMIAKSDHELPDTLNTKDVVIRVERVDDVPLLIGQMLKMGLAEILEKHIPTHWKPRNLSWGLTTIIWLGYIYRCGDHRKIAMEKYVEGMQDTLSSLAGQKIEPLDFSDDRLSCWLKNLSNPTYWTEIETELNKRTIKVYDLETKTIRCDATTVSGNHQLESEGLIQFGHSKDDPNKPQFKMMLGSLDPLGMPLATDVVSGEKADDELYIPVIKRIKESLKKTGLLYVGDCKMSAFSTRLHLVDSKNYYLSPLALTGNTAKEMDNWISLGIDKDFNCELELVFRQNDNGKDVLVAGGYDFEREPAGVLDGKIVEWTERVLVIKSPVHALQQVRGLEKRLDTAIEKIEALTPEIGRGKRQITDEQKLTNSIETILEKPRVTGLIAVDYEKQTSSKTQFVGKGRGSKNRQTQVIKTVRFSITSVTRNEEAINDAKERFGWKAFVTNKTEERLSLSEAVICYRHEYRIERIFNRLKSDLNIAPIFLKRQEQIKGLAHLLSLGVRVLSLVEFVVRRSLQNDNATLSGLHPENGKKKTDKPTAKRLLCVFSNLSLTIIKTSIGEIKRYLTPLSNLQTEILKRLGLPHSLYLKLEIINS